MFCVLVGSVTGKPLAHQISPRRLLGSGACGLLEIFLKQQICHWTGVLCTGRQLANAKLMTGCFLDVSSAKKVPSRISPFRALGSIEGAELLHKCNDSNGLDLTHFIRRGACADRFL